MTMKKKWQSITRDDLIKRMSEKSSAFREEDMKLAVKVILEQLSQTLCTGQGFEIRGFGGFTLRYRTPRTGRNPKTCEKIAIVGRYYPYFRASRELRRRVNKKKNDFH